MNQKLLNINVEVTSYDQVIQKISGWLNESPSGKYICVSNVHMCMEAFDDQKFCNIVNQADLVVPDGQPLVWAQKLFGFRHAEQVRGPNIFIQLCDFARHSGIKIGLYGGSLKSLNQLQANLQKKFPGIEIPYGYSPPFRELYPEEERHVTREIRNAGVQILFVGIGCPKQEKWMAKHIKNLPCIMMGVGAAFDIHSGEKKSAPEWMQTFGLEWFFRLLYEPQRVWKRYLKHNPRFIYYIFKQLFFK